MKAIGVISEFNPFHGGHAYLLQQAKERGEVVVCVMSGNFTQRGEAALLPPVPRAAMALQGGADLVLELPFPFACSSAEYFATAGVRALAGIGVEGICFGSECGNLAKLKEMAKNAAQLSENAGKEKGGSAAFFNALGELPGSNDILALHYLKEANKRKMAAYPVKREGMDYNQTVGEGRYPSAAFLREKLSRGEDISPFLLPETFSLFCRAKEEFGFAENRKCGAVLLSLLRCAGEEERKEFSAFAECGGGLISHLCKSAWQATDYESLLQIAATKRYTNARIRRALLFLLCGVKPSDLAASPVYLRLLAANEKGMAFLAQTRKTRSLPVVTKQSEIAALGEVAARQKELSRRADGVYALLFEKEITPAALAVAKPYFL